MAKKKDTAVVTLKFKVPAGTTAAQAKALVKSRFLRPTIYPDLSSQGTFGEGIIRVTVGAATVIKAKND